MRSKWQLVLLMVEVSILPALAQTVTTSGTTTAGTVPLFGPTSNSTVTNSVITQSGSNVGIGTTGPANPLQVNGIISGGTGSTGGQVILEGNYGYGALDVWASDYSSGAPVTGYAVVPSTSASGAFLSATSVQGPRAALTVGTGGGNIVFYTGPVQTVATGTGVTMSPVMSILNTGSVGIGTTRPSALLEVNGNLKLTSGSGASITFADGTTQSTAYTGITCGGDYAESVDVTGDRKSFAPGDVLVIDPDSPGKFLKSGDPYSSSVTGIYSTKPGTVGRRQKTPYSPEEVPMAMMGIVPVKASAENGAIRPGDLLVTSSKIGYAMKGTDRSRMLGAVIGKALGGIDSGTGVIEIVVTLQ